MPDCITLLEQDHDEVRELLEKLVDTTERAKKTRPELLEEIAHMLRIHTTLEEEIVYPAFRDKAKVAGDERLFHEAKEEHRAVDDLVLPDLEGTDPGTTEFSGRAKVLQDLVTHHADEEESELFPRMKELFSKEELEALGEQMTRRRSQLE